MQFQNSILPFDWWVFFYIYVTRASFEAWRPPGHISRSNKSRTFLGYSEQLGRKEGCMVSLGMHRMWLQGRLHAAANRFQFHSVSVHRFCWLFFVFPRWSFPIICLVALVLFIPFAIILVEPFVVVQGNFLFYSFGTFYQHYNCISYVYNAVSKYKKNFKIYLVLFNKKINILDKIDEFVFSLYINFFM